ncbi:MAG: beta-lactamase family protein [Planctomycetes bacterium]|nr:beta-lactamase family protein [Planctomycetota bacterium]
MRASIARLVALAVLLGTCLLSGASAAATAPPDDAGLERARAFVAGLNAGDVEAWGRFRAEAFAETDPGDTTWRERYAELRERFGALAILDEQVDGDTVVLVLGSGAQPDVELRLEIQLEPEPARRIVSAGLAVEDGGLPSAAELGIGAPPVDPSTSDDDLVPALHAWLADLAARDVFSGVVRVERDGSPVYEEAFGMAEKSFRVPNRVDTPFRIGSIAKTFLQVALAKQIVAGRLSPQTTIAEVLPDYPDGDAAARITVRMLADHTSGLAELRFWDMRELSMARFRRPEDFFPFFAGDPLLFEPGSQQRYSNAGYIVLGAMLEAVSGERWEDLVRQAVLVPAHTEHSGSYALDRVHEGVATGYWKCEGRDGPWCSNTLVLDVEGTPSGGGYCTASDLARIAHALHDGALLDPDWTHWVYTGEWPGALGTRVDRTRWRAQWAGGAEGVNALLAEQGGILVVVLSNHDEPAGELTGLAILQALAR